MWARAGSLLLLVTILGLTVGWELRGLSSYTVPIFMWSDKHLFSKTQVLDTISTGDVEYAFASLLHKNTNKDSKLTTLFNKDVTATELVILFVEPELRTDLVPHIASAYTSTPGGSFSHLKEAMEAAGSTVVMPYATVDEASLYDQALLNTIDSVDGSVFISASSDSDLFSSLRQQNGVKSVPIESLMRTLVSSNVFNNHVTDLVVVCFDRDSTSTDFDAHDSNLGSLMASIRAKGNYVAMYTANKPVVDKLVWTFEEHSKAEFQRSVDLFTSVTDDTASPNNTTPHTTPINYFPGPFIEALLVCAVLITMLFTGACAIFSLQTPDKWEAPKAKRDI